MSKNAISFTDVDKVFDSRNGRTTAVQGMSFAIRKGEFVSVLGRSGCGKSTTVNLILGLLEASAGQVSVLGANPYAEFSSLRGRIACVFQADRLLPWRSAIDNVRLPLEILGINEDDLSVSPEAWLEKLGLGGLASHYAHQLSGGMRQRVAFARALVSDPEIILADEAFGNLDEVTGERLRRDFRSIVDMTGKTVLQITHSIDEAMSLADRILVFGRPGHVVAEITVARGSLEQNQASIRQLLLDHLRATDDTNGRTVQRHQNYA